MKGQGLRYHREGSDLHGEDIREPWGRLEPERDLIPVAVWGGGGMVIGGEKGWPWSR